MADLPQSLFKRAGAPPLWTTETLFLEGDQYFESIIRDIDTAVKLITVEVYIFQWDVLGQKFFEALERAAGRGVEVRLLVDAVGSHGFIQHLQTTNYHERIKVKVFNPHPWTFAYRNWFDLLRVVKTFLTRLLWVNRRNHRKIITIDERTTYIGSFNVAADHLRTVHQELAWQDIGLRLTGWVTPLFILALMKHWGIRDYFRYMRRMPKKKFVRFKHPDIRLNQNFRLRRRLYKDFINRVKNARHRIWIRPGYFLPKRRLVKLLAKAATRGVDVRILVSRKSDVFYYALLQTSYDPYLVKRGVKIFHYLPTITHAKNYFIDDWVTIGSTNLNYRSFMHDLEVDVRVQHPDNRRILSERFEEMCQDAHEVTMSSLALRPWYERWAARLILIFRYWN